MAFTEEELRIWRVEDLKKYLSNRGVPLNTKNCRKQQLIEKVIFAEKLELPTLPSQAVRNLKLTATVGGVQLPFPETIRSHWLEGSEYFPDLTVDVIKKCAEAKESLKVSKEGQNLQTSGHGKSVFFNRNTDCVKYCFIKALVVLQTRISDAPHTVWVSLRTDASSILAGECGCVAGYSNSCKHVFALLYYILAEVRLGNNRSCTGKKQQWSVRTYKKNEKIHKQCQISSVKISHHHPENDDCIQTPSRSEYEPRSIQDLNVAFTKPD